MEEEQDIGTRINEDFSKLVRQGGNKVSIYTEECVIWKLDHPNCKGCSSELGCGKVVKLMLVIMLPTMYQPKNFEDFQKVHQRIEELQKRILHVQSVEELMEIPTV